MKLTTVTLSNVVIINILCFQNVVGRYILVKLDQRALASPKSGDGKNPKFYCYTRTRISLEHAVYTTDHSENRVEWMRTDRLSELLWPF